MFSYWILIFSRFSRTLNAARVILKTFTHLTIKTTVKGGTQRRNLLNCNKLRINQESQNLGTTTVYQIPRNCMLEDCCIVKAWSHCFIFEKNHDKGWDILKILNTWTKGWCKCLIDEMQIYRYLIIFYNETLYVDSTGTGVHIHCTMHSFK